MENADKEPWVLMASSRMRQVPLEIVRCARPPRCGEHETRISSKERSEDIEKYVGGACTNIYNVS